ncbi:hypothetical protein DIPPA_28876 [Diplonema papillatum]|nr:hypothetical protein DIPPA_28876 [Diplonema papillatum]
MSTTASENHSSLVLLRSLLTVSKRKYPNEAIATARANKWLSEEVQVEKEFADKMKPRMERSIHHFYNDKGATYDLGLELDENVPFDLRCSRLFA